MGAKSALTLLNIADGYRIRLGHWRWLRLHKRGRLHWLKLDLDTGGGEFSAAIFLQALIKANCYQYALFDHATYPWPGVHGPFCTDTLAVTDYADLEPALAKSEIGDIVRTEKWQVPPVELHTAGRVSILLERLTEASQQAFRLEACRHFNASARHARDFQHEWAHALLEFHEYLFVRQGHRACDLIYLTYE